MYIVKYNDVFNDWEIGSYIRNPVDPLDDIFMVEHVCAEENDAYKFCDELNDERWEQENDF